MGWISSALYVALPADLGRDQAGWLTIGCNQSVDGGEAVDALLAGLDNAEAEGHWRSDPDSEQRRLALLPQSPPMAWDELMHHPLYQRALERLP